MFDFALSDIYIVFIGNICNKLLIYNINQMEGNSYILHTVYEPHIYISLHDY
jgi:hypothetical protein